MVFSVFIELCPALTAPDKHMSTFFLYGFLYYAYFMLMESYNI